MRRTEEKYARMTSAQSQTLANLVGHPDEADRRHGADAAAAAEAAGGWSKEFSKTDMVFTSVVVKLASKVVKLHNASC